MIVVFELAVEEELAHAGVAAFERRADHHPFGAVANQRVALRIRSTNDSRQSVHSISAHEPRNDHRKSTTNAEIVIHGRQVQNAVSNAKIQALVAVQSTAAANHVE